MNSEALQASLHALDTEVSALSELSRIARPGLAASLDLLVDLPGRVIVSGIGKSGHVGAKIAATLASTGTPSFFVHSTEALHGDSGMVVAGDAAILISNSGETSEVCQFATMLHARGIPIIAMTKDPHSTLARIARIYLPIGTVSEADPLNLAPTTSTTCTLALGDALAAGLMVARGFTPADFALFHPGGSLGHKLSDPQEK